MTLAMTTTSGGESRISRVGIMRFRLESAEEKPERPARSKKHFFESGSWALVFSKPMAQIQKSFCAAFCKKRPLSDQT
jgi:hypothetical protein